MSEVPRSAAPKLSDTEVVNRIRLLQANVKARPIVQVEQRNMSGDAATSKPMVPEELQQVLISVQKTQEKIFTVLEQNLGRVDDEEVWIPWSLVIPNGSATTVAAVVDQDTVFYYKGFGASNVPGSSFTEVIDAKSSGDFFAPPASESSTSDQYGEKGKRVLTRVTVRIANATGAQQTYNGYFRGRFRKGGR